MLLFLFPTFLPTQLKSPHLVQTFFSILCFLSLKLSTKKSSHKQNNTWWQFLIPEIISVPQRHCLSSISIRP
jgi:hypothetical protein